MPLSLSNTVSNSNSIYGSLKTPSANALYSKINTAPISTPKSLTQQVKEKMATAPAPTPAQTLSLTGGANASSLFRNPLPIASVAPNLKGLISPTPLIPKALASISPTQADASANTQNNAGVTAPVVQPQTPAPAQPVPPVTPTQTTTGPEVPSTNPTTNPQPSNISYSDTIKGLLSTAHRGSMAVDLANQNLQDYRTDVAQKEANIVGSGVDLNFKQGESGALQKLSAIGEQTRQQSVANALTAQGNEIGAFGTAAGLAAPIQAPYSNQILDPQTGQPIGGTNGNLATAVSTIAERVKSGSMSYTDAVSALGGYGQGGVNALQQALGPDFNPNSSNALAGSRSEIIGKATTDIANMNSNLSAADNNLSQLLQLAQQGGINDLGSVTANKISNLFKGELNNPALASFNALLAGTRALLAAVLESRANLAPTDAYNAAVQQIPDNENLAVLQARVGTLKSEAQNIITSKQAQIQSAQNPNGQSSTSSSTSGGSLYNW